MTLIHRMKQTLQRLRSDRSGMSAVELGLCLPLIAGMVVPLIDLGMGAYTQMQLQTAVQAGAEYAAVTEPAGFYPDKIKAAVQSATALSVTASPDPTQTCGCVSGTSIVAATPTSAPPCHQTCPTGTVGNYVTVSAASTYTPLFSYPMLPSVYNLTAQAIVRIQ